MDHGRARPTHTLLWPIYSVTTIFCSKWRAISSRYYYTGAYLISLADETRFERVAVDVVGVYDETGEADNEMENNGDEEADIHTPVYSVHKQ